MKNMRKAIRDFRKTVRRSKDNCQKPFSSKRTVDNGRTTVFLTVGKIAGNPLENCKRT